MVEPDYLQRANVDIIKGRIKSFDIPNKYLEIAGEIKPIKFDKLILTYGSFKKRLSK